MKLGVSKYYVKAEVRLDTVIEDIRAEIEKAQGE
jgi:hypothetical protein